LNWSTHVFNDLNVNSLPDGNEICVCIVVVEVGIKSISYLNLNPFTNTSRYSYTDEDI
jgi:hypothetical protein